MRGFGRDTDFGSATFYLSSVWLSLKASELIARPELCGLAAEDTTWRIAMADWSKRPPPRRKYRKRKEWIVEGKALFAEQDHLRAMARACGFAV
jgi:ketosteroid isomerase-like protein